MQLNCWLAHVAVGIFEWSVWVFFWVEQRKDWRLRMLTAKLHAAVPHMAPLGIWVFEHVWPGCGCVVIWWLTCPRDLWLG